MTLTVINTTENALDKFKNNAEKRDCYTEDELNFRYLDKNDGFRYSMQNCLYESVLEVILEDCKCIPSFANFRIKVTFQYSVIDGANMVLLYKYPHSTCTIKNKMFLE